MCVCWSVLCALLLSIESKYMYIFIDSYVYIDTLLTDDDRSIHFTNLSFTDKYDFIAECVHSVCAGVCIIYISVIFIHIQRNVFFFGGR